MSRHRSAGPCNSAGAAAAGGQGAGADLGDALSQLPADQQQQAASALGGGALPTGGGVAAACRPPARSPSAPRSAPACTLATIVDVSSLSLAADVDETDVFLVKPGVKADAELDAVPGGAVPGRRRRRSTCPRPSPPAAA